VHPSNARQSGALSTAAGQSVTINDTQPAKDTFNLVEVEIL
jgi:hypothetical protein